MRIKRSLIYWYSQRIGIVTIFSLMISLAYVVLFRRAPFSSNTHFPWLFLFVHCMTTSNSLGRYNQPQDVFLITRGFSRNALWAHRIIVQLLHGLIVWGASSFAIWTGLRSIVQDRIMQNPDYPIMADREFWIPLTWLCGYLICTSICEYSVARPPQPTLGKEAGALLMGVLFFSCIIILNIGFHARWFQLIVICSLLIVVVTMFWGSWQMHKSLEVCP